MVSINLLYRLFLLIFQELSPTSDTNLVRSLMNLIDCFMDEFTDEVKVKERNDREAYSLLEVRPFACGLVRESHGMLSPVLSNSWNSTSPGGRGWTVGGSWPGRKKSGPKQQVLAGKGLAWQFCCSRKFGWSPVILDPLRESWTTWSASEITILQNARHHLAIRVASLSTARS